MADDVTTARRDLEHAREVAAAFWQRGVDEGRILRQTAAEARKEQTQEQREERTQTQ